jgi:hypothetical protein
MRTLQIANTPGKIPPVGEKHAKTQTQEDERFRPMTVEELNERIDRALEDKRAGRFATHEEVFKRYEKWL